MPRRERKRILGPYPDKGGWRVIVVSEDGARSSNWFQTTEETYAYINAAEVELKIQSPITVEGALEEYERYLKAKGNKAGTIRTTMRRLRNLVGSGANGKLVGLGADGARSAQAYSSLVSRGTGKKPLAADTHRNTLSEAKTFGRWCVKKGYLRKNPFAEVEPVGRKKKGKLQLRVDEARRFTAKALELAEAGDDGAVAALMCLLLGLRASEVVERVGRDVDDAGALLWVDASKTEAGKRVVDVPEMLRSLLETRSAASPGWSRLFHQDRHWVAYHVRRICKLAGVTVVCPHGLRGTHASLAMQAGASSQLVAASLGHSSPEVTLSHYASKQSVVTGSTEKMLKVLAGGRK